MFQLVTFNIRCDFHQDGSNSFVYRKDLILKKIEEKKPDIICFQEVLPHVAAWLKENLTSYYVLGCPRSKDLDDEQMAVAYKRDSYNLIAMETFWLSDTPLIPGSRYKEQSVCPRTCTELLLEDLKAKKVFRIFNTHLDHEKAQARRWGLEQILKKAEETSFFKEAPLFLAGDFNAEPASGELSPLREDKEYKNITENIGLTYHGFGLEKEESIDYIFLRDTKDSLKVISLEKWEDKKEGVWLSDHYPLCASLEWK